MNDIDIDVNVTAWKIGLVIIMRGTATPTARVSHPECFGRFTALALSCDGAIRKCMRVPIDEVKAVILQAHPAPTPPKRPEFLEPRYAPPKPAGISDNRRES